MRPTPESPTMGPCGHHGAALEYIGHAGPASGTSEPNTPGKSLPPACNEAPPILHRKRYGIRPAWQDHLHGCHTGSSRMSFFSPSTSTVSTPSFRSFLSPRDDIFYLNISRFQIHDRCPPIYSRCFFHNRICLYNIPPPKPKNQSFLSKLCKNFLVKFCIQFSDNFVLFSFKKKSPYSHCIVCFHGPACHPPGRPAHRSPFALCRCTGRLPCRRFLRFLSLSFLDITSAIRRHMPGCHPRQK